MKIFFETAGQRKGYCRPNATELLSHKRSELAVSLQLCAPKSVKDARVDKSVKTHHDQVKAAGRQKQEPRRQWSLDTILN
jgi:hypothetical protein